MRKSLEKSHFGILDNPSKTFSTPFNKISCFYDTTKYSISSPPEKLSSYHFFPFWSLPSQSRAYRNFFSPLSKDGKLKIPLRQKLTIFVCENSLSHFPSLRKCIYNTHFSSQKPFIASHERDIVMSRPPYPSSWNLMKDMFYVFCVHEI